MLTAITRAVSPNINQCELTHLARKPIDFKVARTQHQHYEEALQALGYEVKTLPAEAALPDSVFVEDTAIVLDELAIITRPGAASRRPEVESIRQALEPFRSVQTVQAPALLDGGDVLKIGKRLYVGLSTRTNREAVGQLHGIVAPYGYSAHAVEFQGCLHLKSAVTCVGECTLLINPEWVVPDGFDGIDCIAVDPSEPFAANALQVGNTVLYPAQYPATAQRLRQQGLTVMTVDASELSKAEGGVTCCSLTFEA